MERSMVLSCPARCLFVEPRRESSRVGGGDSRVRAGDGSTRQFAARYGDRDLNAQRRTQPAQVRDAIENSASERQLRLLIRPAVALWRHHI
jgi:hypothetical protein